MNPLKKINIMGGDYEFTLNISGPMDNFDLDYVPSDLPDIYKKILNQENFHVSEFSLSNYCMMRERDICQMTAIPVFVNRGFRHSIIWVRKDSNLNSVTDFKNSKIGIKEYSQTAAVWLRGILLEEYDLHWSSINWYANNKQRFTPPTQANVKLVSEDPEELVINGELDAYVAPRPLDIQKSSKNRVLRPLINNHVEVEKKYFETSGIYPINHCVMIHHHTLIENPEIGYSVFKAYSKSKEKALKRKLGATLLPWVDRQWSEVIDIFNGDPYPFGLTDINRKNVQKLVEYLHEQKLIENQIKIDDLFTDDSIKWSE
jgi:4,5-dihydroxyphthalate decarboxylase